MIFRFLLFASFLFCCSVVNGQETDSLTTKKITDLWKRNYSGHLSTSIDKKKQDTWINQKKTWMLDSLEVATLEYADPNIIDIPDLQKVSYKIKTCQNLQMINKEIITICVHSAHNDPDVGDVCMGKTSKNIFFVNFGHVCGGLINFESFSLSLPLDSIEFFNNFVSDTDGQGWVRIGL